MAPFVESGNEGTTESGLGSVMRDIHRGVLDASHCMTPERPMLGTDIQSSAAYRHNEVGKL